MKFFAVITFLTPCCFSFSQVSYDDVAVIVNNNSQISLNIGEYFKTQRNIPDANIIHINAPTTETIDSIQFLDLKLQIETYLTNSNLENSINYLVTTKGVPHKIERGDCSHINCTSLESELTLLLSDRENLIGTTSSAINLYYNANVHFSNSDFDMYLVTRLDGFTETDIISMIDRSGPDSPVNKNSSQNIYDINCAFNDGTAEYLGAGFQQSADFSEAEGWNTILDTTLIGVLNQNNVFLYTQYESYPNYNELDFTWTKGSFAELISHNSASTFNPGADIYDRVLLAEMIAEGATSGHAYCYGPFFTQVMNNTIFINRYLDTIKHYNLAESVFMSEPNLSMQSLTIGDPKTTIVIDNTANVGNIKDDQFVVFPNPAQDYVQINAGEKIEKISLHDLTGKVVFESRTEGLKTIQIEVSQLAKGTYFLKFALESQVFAEKIVIQ